MRKLTQCMKCVHQMEGRKCSAYPKEIPYTILSDKINHNKIFEDQVGDYIYNPKKEYIEYDSSLNKKYEITPIELEKIKTEIAQLYYHELTSRSIITKDWDYAKLDIELHSNNRFGGKFNELSVVINKCKKHLDFFPSSNLTSKILFLLAIKANHFNSRRFILKIFPENPAMFEFT
ncbi:MAG: hypothetical protein AB8F94_02135 [Saprospiraceae bacterium]